MISARHFLPPVVWMAAIFLFSTSIFGGEHTYSLLSAVLGRLFPGADPVFIQKLNDSIRVLGHVTEYMLLSWLWASAFVKGSGMGPVRAAAAAFGISAAYALTDEYHQSFVPNRVASLVDVTKDWTGAALGSVLFEYAQKKRSREAVRM